jgi:uncharacterized protein
LRSDLSNTAILLFSRSSAAEATAKPLIEQANYKKNKTVAAHLIQYARQVAKASGLPVFDFSECAQYGATFGERFADAFCQVFSRGFDRIIAIGNDCPALTTTDLLAAARQLEQHAAVFGPSTDGGAYLVGLRRAAFEQQAFAQINWQTNRTYAGLQTYAGDNYTCLSEKSDIDSATELQRQLKSRFFPVLLKIKLALLLAPMQINGYIRPFFAPSSHILRAGTLRGPPAV